MNRALKERVTQITSLKDVEKQYNAIPKLFKEKESDSNWEERLSVIKNLRSVLDSDLVIEHKENIGTGLRKELPAIIKSILSLRSTVAVEALSLLIDASKKLGNTLDQYTIGTIVDVMLKCSVNTKKMITTKLAEAAVAFLSNTNFHYSVLVKLCRTKTEKSVQLRQYACSNIKIILETHGTKEHVRTIIDTSNGLSLIEAFLKKGLSDASPIVRESCRLLYKTYHKLWPDNANTFCGSLDTATQKQLQKPVPVARSARASTISPKTSTGSQTPSPRASIGSQTPSPTTSKVLVRPSLKSIQPAPLSRTKSLTSMHTIEVVKAFAQTIPNPETPTPETTVSDPGELLPGNRCLTPVTPFPKGRTVTPSIYGPRPPVTTLSRARTLAPKPTLSRSRTIPPTTTGPQGRLLAPTPTLLRPRAVTTTTTGIQGRLIAPKPTALRERSLTPSSSKRTSISSQTPVPSPSTSKTKVLKPKSPALVNPKTPSPTTSKSIIPGTKTPSPTTSKTTDNKTIQRTSPTPTKPVKEAEETNKFAEEASLLHEMLKNDDPQIKCKGLSTLASRLRKVEYSPTSTCNNLPLDVPNKMDLLNILMDLLTRKDLNTEVYEALMGWESIACIFVYIMSFNYYCPTLVIAAHQRLEKSPKITEINQIYSKGLTRVKTFLKRHDSLLAKRLLDILDSTKGDQKLLDASVKQDLLLNPSYKQALQCGILTWMDEILGDYVGLAEDEDPETIKEGESFLNVTGNGSCAEEWFDTSDNIKSYATFIIHALRTTNSQDDSYPLLCSIIGKLKLANPKVFDEAVGPENQALIERILMPSMVTDKKSLVRTDPFDDDLHMEKKQCQIHT